MKKITIRTTLREIYALPELAPYSKYLIYSPLDEPQDENGRSFSDTALQDLRSVGWSPEGIAAGVNFLLDCVSRNRVRQHFVYPDDEKAGKRDVNLLQIDPEQSDP